jgi:MFS family permease
MGDPKDLHTLLRPTRVRFGVLGFACTLSLITYLDRICIMRSRTDIERDLGFSDYQMGWIFGAFTTGYTLFEVLAGYMGDKWGSRRIITRIVLWWSAFTALTGSVVYFSYDTGRTLSLGPWTIPLVFDAFMLMLLVRFLFGAGEAGAYPNLTRVVSDWFPARERASAQGAIWMSARLGGFLAPLVIGRLTVWLGWRQAFWVLGAVGLAWAMCFFQWFRSKPDTHPGCNAAERDLIQGRPSLVVGDAPRVQASDQVTLAEDRLHSSPSGAVGWLTDRDESQVSVPLDRIRHEGSGHAWPGVGRLASSLTLWAVASAAFWVCFGWYFYITWQPRYLEEVHGYRADGWESEVLTGLPFLCGAVGALIGGRLSDRLLPRLGPRWGRSAIGLVGFGAAAFCVLGAAFAISAWQVVALLCLASLVNDLAIPVIWAVSADVGGRFAGTVAAVMNTVGGVGAVLSPLLIPRALNWLSASHSVHRSWQLVLVGLSGAWFLAAASWLFIDASKQLPQEA